MTKEVDKRRDRIVVSLGDSYSSGEGIAPYYGQGDRKSHNYDWLAHRSEKSWPGLLVLSDLGKMADHKDDRWFFAAGSGATTRHLRARQEKRYHKDKKSREIRALLPTQLKVIKDLKAKNQKVDYVTLTLGGNDARFVEIMKTAGLGTYLTPASLINVINQVWIEFFKPGGTFYKLYKAYKDIEKEAGKDAHILVAGYPKILSPKGSGLLFNQAEAHLINTSVSKINLLIKGIVSKCQQEGMNISFVSVEEAFEGHGAYTPNPFIHGLVWGLAKEDLKLKGDWFSAASFHPNEKGARAYAACVQKRIDELEGCREEISLTEAPLRGLPSLGPAGVPETVALRDAKAEIEDQALRRYLEASSRPKDKGPRPDKDIKMQARRLTIDPRDQIALRRIIGKDDLLPISYLQRGFRMSESVCRIVLRDRAGTMMGFGTGFLVSPQVIITNHHVLPDVDAAARALAEFNYQHDEDFRTGPVHPFALNPQGFFMTDKDLDFTLVALNPIAESGQVLEDLPHIKLNPQRGKVLEEEYVSIIQHPGGGLKSVTVRENQVKFLFDDFIQYTTDTKHGSSGSPVFNDQWKVVALHHSGVPDPNRKFHWIANEGVRISSIAEQVKNRYQEAGEQEQEILEGIFMELKALRIDKQEGLDQDQKPQDENKKPLKADQYREGYDPYFLGQDYRIDLPKLSKEMEEDSTRLKDGSNILDYVHFSVVMKRSRRLAYFTAVNIDGKSLRRDVSRVKWSLDSRISRKAQYGNEVYKDNKLDRGHLVRRLDPVWGEKAAAHQANADTFYYTNCAPQHEELNQKTWLGLEDYLLTNAQNHGLQISVFTGPVFRADDPIYRDEYQIPVEFWKVVAMVKGDGMLSATAYIQSQDNYIRDLEFAYGAYQTYQVPLGLIEELTGLDFGDLYQFDPMGRDESSGILISELSNIRL